MNNCLCFERDVNIYPLNELPPSACNFKCEDHSDDVYSGDCGGESAYNIYEIQGGTLYILWCTFKIKYGHIVHLITSFSVLFNSVERCLTLQCSKYDNRFIPKECSVSLRGVCENMSKFGLFYSIIYWLMYFMLCLMIYWNLHTVTLLNLQLVFFKQA